LPLLKFQPSYFDTEAVPTSYLMTAGGFVLESKAAGAWNWPFIFTKCRDQEWLKLYIRFMAWSEKTTFLV